MLSVVPILERIAPLSPEALFDDVLRRFRSDPALVGLPVLSDQVLVGVISRERVNHVLLEGSTAHTAAELVDCDGPTLEIDIDIGALDPSMLVDPVTRHPGLFLITRAGQYEGLCSGIDMLRLIQDDQARQIRRQAFELSQGQHAKLAGTSSLFQVFGDKLLPQLKQLRDAHSDLHRRMARHPLAVSLERIRFQVRELEHRFTAAMELGHLAADKRTLTDEPVALRNLMDQVLHDWEPRFAAAGPGLSVSYEGDTDLVALTDGRALRQVMDCLLARTLDRSGDGVVEVALSARRAAGQIHLLGRVRDEGCTQPPDVLAMFSDPDAPPHDLDQALSLQLVHRLGGAIRAENNAGLGSSVLFELSVPEAVANCAQTDLDPADEAQAEPVGRILIVDDNATNRIVAQALCEMFGFETHTVEDGQEAVEAVGNDAFDVILMDIKMPRMDGLEATSIILGMEGSAATTPILALTANADPEDKARYLAAGMQAVIEKPIKPEHLLAALNQALGAPDLSPQLAQTGS